MGVRTGTSVVIANGGRENVLAGIWGESVPASLFPARITPLEGRKRWLLTQRDTAGSVTVDPGAANAVTTRGTSLLPVGIVEVHGEFDRGEIISVRSQDSPPSSVAREIARGLCNYSSADLGRILGQHSGDILEILGYDYGPEFIHRDKMVLL
jgi:glutamate 5-kinase